MTQTSDTFERLVTLTAARFKRDTTELAPEADVFETLAVDSMQVMELLTELEMAFDVEIPDYELRGVRTFAQLADVIERRL